MLVCLVGAEIEENLSIRYLASSLRTAGHEAVIVPFDGPSAVEEAAGEIMGSSPGLVGMSMVNQMRASEYYSLSRRVRSLGYLGHITVGGHFPTFTYAEMLSDCQAIDSVVRHEGERTIVELASLLEEGGDLSRIEGLVYRAGDGLVCNPARRPEADLDSLPFPARDGTARLHLGIPTATIVGSRGCYGNCSFCCINAWHKGSGGPKYRMRSPENLVSEMASLYHERGVRFFIFHDDNFFLPKVEDSRRRIEEIGRLMARQGIKDAGLVVKCRPNDVDRDLFAYLKELGLIRVYVGIETNAVAGLKTLNRRVSKDENRRALEILRSLDIYACFNVLIFDPESTLDDIGENIEFLREHDYYPFNFCRTEAYAHTPIQERLLREGRLKGSYLAWDYDIADSRTELLFRICAVAFWERNFTDNGLANRNMGFGYQLRLLQRFYVRAYEPSLGRKAEDLTRRINRDTLGFLERAHAFAKEADLEDRQAIVTFTVQLAREVNRRNLCLGDEMTDLEQQFALLAAPRPLPRQVSAPLRLLAWLPGRAASASLASLLFMAACDPAPPPAPADTTAPISGSTRPPTHSGDTASASAGVGTTTAEVDGGFQIQFKTTGASLSEANSDVRRSGWIVQAELAGPDAQIVGTPSVSDTLGLLKDTSPVVSPEGRHISFRFGPTADMLNGKTRGPEGTDTVEVVFLVQRDGKTGEVRNTKQFYVFKGGASSVGPNPPEHPIMAVDPVARPAPTFTRQKPVSIETADQVFFARSDTDLGLTGYVEFNASLKRGFTGQAQGEPEITASSGTIDRTRSGEAEGKTSVWFDYLPPEKDGRLVPGPITITVTFRVLDNGQINSYMGELHLNIGDDGDMKIVDNQQSMVDPAPSPAVAMLSMRWRFGLEILCRDLGDGRLELTGKPSGVDERTLRYRWTTEDGHLSKSEGETTIWQPLVNGGHQQVQLAVITPEADLMVVSRDVVI